MRNAFAQEITLLAQKDPRIVLLSGDIGNKLFDGFKAAYPSRFLNCGVAESNMASMAAGLALLGFRPFTYTIASFNVYRCFEHLRVDLGYHNLPVVVVGVGAGLSYAELGGTHHSCEDLAVLRSIPNFSIVCPADQTEVKASLKASLENKGPVYIRLGKKGEPAVHQAPLDSFAIGKPVTVRSGQDLCILAVGNMAHECIDAAALLAKSGISVEVVSFHTVKPLNSEYLISVFAKFSKIVTVEEHSSVGGLGSSVAEWYVDQLTLPRARLHRISTPDKFLMRTANQEEARTILGLDASGIAANLLNLWKKEK